MKVIILAGGKATRLPISAKDIPKALIEVGGKSILLHQIEMLKKQGFCDIRLSLCHKADKIVKYLESIGEKCEYLIEGRPLGTGGALKYASQDLKEDFLVLNGDILTDLDFKSFWQFHQDLKKKDRLSDLSSMALYWKEKTTDYGLAELKDGKIINFLEKPKTEREGYINAGIYILSPKIFENISQKSFSIEKEVFPELVKTKKLAGFIHKGRWAHPGTEEDLADFRKDKIPI